MAFRHMVDLARSPEEKEEAVMPVSSVVSDYPYGLCIALSHDELEKLDLDPECEIGDMLHGFFMAKVTSVSMNASEGSDPSCRIELQITHLALEDEDTETEPD